MYAFDPTVCTLTHLHVVLNAVLLGVFTRPRAPRANRSRRPPAHPCTLQAALRSSSSSKALGLRPAAALAPAAAAASSRSPGPLASPLRPRRRPRSSAHPQRASARLRLARPLASEQLSRHRHPCRQVSERRRRLRLGSHRRLALGAAVALRQLPRLCSRRQRWRALALRQQPLERRLAGSSAHPLRPPRPWHYRLRPLGRPRLPRVSCCALMQCWWGALVAAVASGRRHWQHAHTTPGRGGGPDSPVWVLTNSAAVLRMRSIASNVRD